MLGTVIPDDGNHEAPYDVAVDTRTDTIYVGDVDGSARVDKYSAHRSSTSARSACPASSSTRRGSTSTGRRPGRGRRLAQEQDRGVQRHRRAALRVRVHRQRARTACVRRAASTSLRRPAVRARGERRAREHLPARRDVRHVGRALPDPDRRHPWAAGPSDHRRGDRGQHRGRRGQPLQPDRDAPRHVRRHGYGGRQVRRRRPRHHRGRSGRPLDRGHAELPRAAVHRDGSADRGHAQPGRAAGQGWLHHPGCSGHPAGRRAGRQRHVQLADPDPDGDGHLRAAVRHTVDVQLRPRRGRRPEGQLDRGRQQRRAELQEVQRDRAAAVDHAEGRPVVLRRHCARRHDLRGGRRRRAHRRDEPVRSDPADDRQQGGHHAARHRGRPRRLPVARRRGQRPDRALRSGRVGLAMWGTKGQQGTQLAEAATSQWTRRVCTSPTRRSTA